MTLRCIQKLIGGVLPLSIIQIEIVSLPSLIIDKTLLSFMKNTTYKAFQIPQTRAEESRDMNGWPLLRAQLEGRLLPCLAKIRIANNSGLGRDCLLCLFHRCCGHCHLHTVNEKVCRLKEICIAIT